LNPGLVGIPGFGESGIPVWSGSSRDSGNRESRFGRDPGIREIGNPDLAGIGKINPDARASGISGSGPGSKSCLLCTRQALPGSPGIPDFDLRPIGTPIPVSRPNRPGETGDSPIPVPGQVGNRNLKFPRSPFKVSRPNRELGERELGISGSDRRRPRSRMPPRRRRSIRVRSSSSALTPAPAESRPPA
jgi:hypothetical protein